MVYTVAANRLMGYIATACIVVVCMAVLYTIMACIGTVCTALRLYFDR